MSVSRQDRQLSPYCPMQKIVHKSDAPSQFKDSPQRKEIVTFVNANDLVAQN